MLICLMNSFNKALRLEEVQDKLLKINALFECDFAQHSFFSKTCTFMC